MTTEQKRDVRRGRTTWFSAFAGMFLLLASGLHAQGHGGVAHAASSIISEPAVGITVSVDPAGAYSITSKTPSWTFAGAIGNPLSNLSTISGSDHIGAYQEITFDYSVGSSQRNSAIRAYQSKPIILFTTTYQNETRNSAPFPALSTYPHTPYHMSYKGMFADYRFDLQGYDGPLIGFDSGYNTFVLSAASDAMVATSQIDSSGALQSGINSSITTLPAGFQDQVMLVIGQGINRTIDQWGQAMTDVHGKIRPSNEADVGLRYLGYWTDHGASYYCNYDRSKGYTGTLLAVRDAFLQAGIHLGYMQLDSWWYPKGPQASWSDNADGEYTYNAASDLFPQGLAAFQQQLGLPLIVHARWIDTSSPYRDQYLMSNNVSIDPAFWAKIASYIKNSGAVTYEQDWLYNKATAAFTIHDQDAFMDDMAQAMAADGVTMQYSMPDPRHYMQSALYNNLYTIRVSGDRFDNSKWDQFLYGSRLASALGIWPWSDVFMSNEMDNLLLATLSGGMVGVGDSLGALNASNLLRAVRPDGVIVKPDVAVVPVDQTYVSDASGQNAPMLASTYTTHGRMRAAYVFAYSRGGSSNVSFTPASLGITGTVYVYNYFTGQGTIVGSSNAFTDTVSTGSYYVVVPVGPSGIAFLGDAGKFVSLGRQRITQLSDTGSVQATIATANGEGPVTLRGYAPAPPVVTASHGSVGLPSYNSSTGQFTVQVTAASDGTAAVTISMPTSVLRR